MNLLAVPDTATADEAALAAFLLAAGASAVLWNFRTIVGWLLANFVTPSTHEPEWCRRWRARVSV